MQTEFKYIKNGSPSDTIQLEIAYQLKRIADKLDNGVSVLK